MSDLVVSEKATIEDLAKAGLDMTSAIENEIASGTQVYLDRIKDAFISKRIDFGAACCLSGTAFSNRSSS